ncbi:unnamed protein product [Linum tenue]|uniref:Uncharacterized protein n=1 Tax=Linum tenue TaxID=586396 RepID=A0AAV0R6B2_9ROSI|nr:unnamed protein product [Linum tenue]
MSSKSLFVVEQEANHNSNRLVDRFVDGLHYYSAIFDSIDATFGNTRPTREQAQGRIMLKEMFGREIENMVAYEGLDRVERPERFSRWELRMTRVGFRPVRMWYNSDEDAKQMVGLPDESKHAAKVPMVLAVTLDWFSVITEVQEEITG